MLNIRNYLAIGFLWFGLSASFAQDPNFHIYLAIGQSNMDGAGTIEAQDRTGVDARFQVLYGVNCSNPSRTLGTWYKADPPICRCGSGLSVTDYFGRTMVANLPAEIKVGLVVVAVAGSKIEIFDKANYQAYIDTAESWMQGWINEYNRNPYGRLVELGLQAKRDGVIKGILVHQGESNSGDRQWPSKIKKIYNDLMTDLSLDPTKTPLLAGELVYSNQGGCCGGMNAIIDTLPRVLPNSYVISAQGLAQKGDGFHFTSAAYRTFGQRYAEKMLEVLDQTPVEPPITVPPHRDTVFNGLFDLGVNGWTLNVWAGAATGSVVNGEYKITLTSLGTSNYQIQLIQNGIILQQGKSYELAFDAYATAARSLEVNVEKDVSPWNTYLPELKTFQISTQKSRFTTQFTMESPTDSSSRISFNAGANLAALMIDNVSIREVQITTYAVKNNSKPKVEIQFLGNQIIANIFSGNQNRGVTIKVMDMHGKLVQSAEFSANLNNQYYSMNIEGLKRSLYIVVIEMDHQIIGSKKQVLGF